MDIMLILLFDEVDIKDEDKGSVVNWVVLDIIVICGVIDSDVIEVVFKDCMEEVFKVIWVVEDNILFNEVVSIVDLVSKVDVVLFRLFDNIWLKVLLLDDDWEIWLGENCWLILELDRGKVVVFGWIGIDEFVEVIIDCFCLFVKENVCFVCKVGRIDWVE